MAAQVRTPPETNEDDQDEKIPGNKKRNETERPGQWGPGRWQRRGTSKQVSKCKTTMSTTTTTTSEVDEAAVMNWMTDYFLQGNCACGVPSTDEIMSQFDDLSVTEACLLRMRWLVMVLAGLGYVPDVPAAPVAPVVRKEAVARKGSLDVDRCSYCGVLLNPPPHRYLVIEEGSTTHACQLCAATLSRDGALSIQRGKGGAAS